MPNSINSSVDIGNSRVKIGFFEGRNFLNAQSVISEEELLELLKEKKPARVIISAVTEVNRALIDEIALQSDCLLFHYKLSLPIKITYQTPHTLGADRLASVLGARAQAKTDSLLAIDMGTCVTYDYLHSQKEYLGGGITPGFGLRLRSMNTFTAKLPLLNPGIATDFTGTDTNSCMINGTYHGLLSEILGNISHYQKKAKPAQLKVFITGGDAPFFLPNLPKNCCYDPHLVLKGLNNALLYQYEKH